MNKIKVSIIIPCYFRSQLLKWGLESISQQKINYDYEILILNDGLPDETEKICDFYKNRLNIRYYFTGERNLKETKWRIPGIVFNKGVELANGNIIILSSPEIFHLNNDSINQLVKPLETQSKILVIPDGKDDYVGKFLSYLEKNYPPIDENYLSEVTMKLDTLLPFCMAMKKQDFLDIGGFDVNFAEGYCFDDNDLVKRLTQNGCNYFRVPIKVVHLFHPRFPTQRIGLKNIKELYERNWQLFKRKFKK
jgi:glycosyltransferase involved in cell wall biosynthesis